MHSRKWGGKHFLRLSLRFRCRRAHNGMEKRGLQSLHDGLCRVALCTYHRACGTGARQHVLQIWNTWEHHMDESLCILAIACLAGFSALNDSWPAFLGAGDWKPVRVYHRFNRALQPDISLHTHLCHPFRRAPGHRVERRQFHRMCRKLRFGWCPNEGI